MPKLITRRRLLYAGGVVVGGCALATGGFLIHDHRQRFGREADKTIIDHRIDLPSTVPRMVVAHGSDPRNNVQAVLDRLGGMKRFIGKDDIVVVKPNIGWARTPAQGANTHPDVVSAVVRACREVGPKRLIVSDCPTSDSKKSFQLSGIDKAAAEAGAEVLPPEDSVYHTVEISERLGTWDVLEPFVIATKLINVPVAKSHSLTGVTSGLKNWIGITAKLRLMFHNDIQRSIAELAVLMRPTLTVVDASRVLMDHGPQGGNLADVKQMSMVAAGTDPVALDAWAFSLFGVGIDELPESLHLVQQAGHGQIDYEALQPVEIVTGT
ncbi:MAG: DUF362 domain-containing protein [Deltaproteobacteria bacterium]|nr:DUF362 domain-containing protein [Deltaproteobacteria bacterium]